MGCNCAQVPSFTLKFEGACVNCPSDGSGGTFEVIDEDDMASNSDTKVPTQQSVKAYADTKVAKAATSTSGFGFVVDEDNMASNSATKLPTQQSVKAYVDGINPIKSLAQLGIVGDGVTDDTLALRAAVTSEKVLFIPRGRNLLLTGVITLPSNITIFGAGKFTAGPLADFATGQDGATWGMFIATAQNNIKLEGMEFDISAWTDISAEVGLVSTRCVLFRRCTNVLVQQCTFLTTGGSVAFVGCAGFDVVDNTTTCVPTLGADNTVFSDGVIDVWVEWNIHAVRFEISGNLIKGEGAARWGIMLTGLEFSAVNMDVKNAVIANNIIEDCFFDGMWIFGRDAILDGITVTGNVIDTARKGIAISDARNLSVSNNVVKNTTGNGIHLYSEFADGVQNSVTDSIISGNRLSNVNTSGGASSAAIWLANASTGNLIGGNSIGGGAYDHGILCGTAAINNKIAGNKIAQGGAARIRQFALGNLIDGIDYSPTLTGVANVSAASNRATDFYATNDRVTVFFRVNVTPTAGSSTVTQTRLSLPVPSDLTADTLFGSGAIAGAGTVAVFADAVNNEAIIYFLAPGTGQQTVNGSFSYRIA